MVSSLRKIIGKDVPIRCVNMLWHSRGQNFDVHEGDDLERLLFEDLNRQLPTASFLPVAHSFGIRPLLDFLEVEPMRCPEIIVEDSLPELSLSGFEFLSGVLKETPSQFEDRASARDFFDLKYGSGVLSRFLLSNVGPDKESGKMGWRFNSSALFALLQQARTRPLWGTWEKYPGKINLFVGDKSDVLTSELLENAVKRRASLLLELSRFDQSAHWIHFDQLEMFVHRVAKVFKGLD